MSSNMATKLLRVTQIDAVQLDEEIFKIFRTLVDDAIKYLPAGLTVPFEPEINLLVRLLILNYSVLKDNATFGQKLMLIKYSNFTERKKLFYVVLSSLGYIKDRIEHWNPRYKINKIIKCVEFFTLISAMVNMTIFLRTGEKPILVDRILGLKQEYVTYKPRKFDNKYLLRELIWNGFIEILLFVLPLINYHKLKRILRNTFTFFGKSVKKSFKFQRRVYNLDTKCPHCKERPVLAHHMGCPHIFCYVCLKGNQLADSNYECPNCGYTNSICERVVV